jgi:mxaJ protein
MRASCFVLCASWLVVFSSCLLACVAGCTRTASISPPKHEARSTKHDVLRVCSDPNNLPFSSADRSGFENKIADLVAHDFNARVDYTWLPQRLGFVRNTLGKGDCDVIIGVPSNYELASPTAPYYRSSYVFVWRKDRAPGVESLDDAKLKKLKIGVQLAAGASPPLQALANRHLMEHTRVYPVVGDGGRALVDAVARGEVDLAIVWGPQAGYFAKEQRAALELTPVSPQIDPPFLPFVFDISMGVRRGDTALRDKLDAEIERRRPDIERILDAYGVPRV